MSVYKNGNTIVEIRNDGTKIRYVPDNQLAKPEYPESIDLKISNRCSICCPQCHECSTPDGAMGNLDHPLLNSLKPYTELAIGGGNPMEHPDLEVFLNKMKNKDVICNITVHWQTFLDCFNTLLKWTNKGLIHGLGVSINEITPCGLYDKLIEFPNAVIHTIIGVADKSVFRQTMDRYLNILLLGYKIYGRGINYQTDNPLDIATNTVWVQQHLSEFVDHYKAVSFDNLAIEQTGLRHKLKKELFDQIYMGEDGAFTMYVDLVENKYAISSTSPRMDIDSNEISELFKRVRERR